MAAMPLLQADCDAAIQGPPARALRFLDCRGTLHIVMTGQEEPLCLP